MMRLSLMRDFFATVDDRRRSPLLDQLAARWFTEPVACHILRASANFVGVIQTPGGARYLRFNHASERRAEDYQAETGFIRHLARCGLRVSEPVPSLARRTVESVDTGLGVMHAVLFTGVTGEELEFDALDLDGFARWGAALGRLHRLGRDHGTDRGRPAWRDHLAWIERRLAVDDTHARSELSDVERRLAGLAESPAGFGLIHGDFELDNLRWENGAAGVLDFDECGYYWYEADIAFALRDLWQDRIERIDLEEPRLTAFLGGYRAEWVLAAEAVRRLPLFLRLHNLLMYAKLLRSTADIPAEEEPEWLTGLRGKLAGVIERYRTGFADHPLIRWIG